MNNSIVSVAFEYEKLVQYGICSRETVKRYSVSEAFDVGEHVNIYSVAYAFDVG